MKTIIIVAVAAFAMLAASSGAQAVECAKGVYRAGCVGPNGAAAVRRPATGGAAVVRRPATGSAAVVHGPAGAAVVHTPAPAAGCAWVNGHRVCR